MRLIPHPASSISRTSPLLRSFAALFLLLVLLVLLALLSLPLPQGKPSLQVLGFRSHGNIDFGFEACEQASHKLMLINKLLG